MPVLSLPPGFLVVFEGGSVAAVLDDRNNQVYPGSREGGDRRSVRP